MDPDPRIAPLIDLDRASIVRMLAPVTGGATPRDVERVDGGLTNTVFRVTMDDGTVYALRVHAADRQAFELERSLLSSMPGVLPVPEVLLADGDGTRCAYPYVVSRWIDGITLNELRRRSDEEMLLELARPLGRLLAGIAGALRGRDEESFTTLPISRLSIADRLRAAGALLESGPARERLGDALAGRFHERLAGSAPWLEPMDASGLVHGDFSGRNVLVRQTDDSRWTLAGVLDWEAAAIGSGLWDVGSLFRYPRRFEPAFRAAFAAGYREAGVALPEDWWLAARLLDATRLVSILAEPRELPTVHAECRELIASLTDQG